jgi:hypothetical protein
MIQDDVVARAKSGLAIQKLVPLGEYLDLSENGILASDPVRYQTLATEGTFILRQFRTDERVRDICQDSPALLALLENVDFEAGAGAIADSRRENTAN